MFFILLKKYKKPLEVLSLNNLLEKLMKNNITLKQIIRVINTWIKHHSQENANDFILLVADLILIKYLKNNGNNK